MADHKSFLAKIKDAWHNPNVGAAEPFEEAHKRILGFVYEAVGKNKKVVITQEMKDLGMEGEIRIIMFKHEQKYTMLRKLNESEFMADQEELYGYD